MSVPIEFETNNVPQHRSLKDQFLTVRSRGTHQVRPQRPSETYTVPPDMYSQFHNVTLPQNPHTGIYQRASRDLRSKKDIGVVLSFNNTTHLDATTANEAQVGEVNHEQLREFPNIVQYHDLANESTRVQDDARQYTTGQLLEQSNESHLMSQRRRNNPKSTVKNHTSLK